MSSITKLYANKVAELEDKLSDALQTIENQEKQLRMAADDISVYNQCYDYSFNQATCPMYPCDGTCFTNWRNRWKQEANK